MASTFKSKKRGDMEEISTNVTWMETEYAVKKEANSMKAKLHAIRKKIRKANYSDIKGCNKSFIEWNEEMLSFCKANRRKYHMESRTEKLDRQRLEDQMMICQKEEEIEKLSEKLKEEEDAKDLALNRLSELQAHLLKFGNPEITDLSDKNRPTKLGEKYKELYSNEWTDVFEFLTEQKEKEDKKAIHILYAMLKSCSELCSASIRKQYKTLTGLVIDPLQVKVSKSLPPGASRDVVAGNQKVADTTHVQAVNEVETNKQETDGDVLHGRVEVAVKEFSKSTADESLKNVTVTDILPVMKKEQLFTEDILQNDDVKVYLEQTFKLCWLMQTQHPPMVIDFTKTPGSAFDTNVYESYTARGPIIEQIVWPPVYLHANGPVVSKGVAQGTNE